MTAIDVGLLRRLLHAAAVGGSQIVIVVDDTACMVWASDTVQEIGWKPSDAIGRSPFEFVHPDDVARATMGIQTLDQVPNPIPFGFRLRQGDGTYQRVESTGTLVHVDGRDWVVFTMWRMLIEHMAGRSLAELARGGGWEEALRVVADTLSDIAPEMVAGIAFDGPSGRDVIGPLDPLLVGVAGGGQDLEQGTPWAQALTTGELTAFDVTDDAPASLAVLVETARSYGYDTASFFPINDPAGGVPALLAVWYMPPRIKGFMDLFISEMPVDLIQVTLASRHERSELERLARRDALTDLANRQAFFEALSDRPPEGDDGVGATIGVIYIDLDDFKPVNDTYGHEMGDRVLQTIAARFRGTVRGGDVVARLGGDEFAVLCVAPADEGEVMALAARLVGVATEPIRGSVCSDGTSAHVAIGASAGVAFAESFRPADSAALLRRADGALYDAKRSGKGTVALAT